MLHLPNGSRLWIERFAPSAWKAERLLAPKSSRCYICRMARDCGSGASLPRLGKPSDYWLRNLADATFAEWLATVDRALRSLGLESRATIGFEIYPMLHLPNGSRLWIERFAYSAWKAERLLVLKSIRCDICRMVRDCGSSASLPRLRKPSDYWF